MPFALLRRLIESMPRLAAEEAHSTSTQVAVGTGSIKQPEAIRRQWLARANGEQGPSGERHSGLSALSALQAANERARERGELWEQLQGASA